MRWESRDEVRALSQTPDYLYFDKIGNWGGRWTGTAVLTEQGVEYKCPGGRAHAETAWNWELRTERKIGGQESTPAKCKARC